MKRIVWRSIGLWAALGLFASPAAAQTRVALDPAALAPLRRMANTLQNLPSLRVQAEVEYDALQRDGQTIEFGATREVAMRRPDRIRAHATDRSGAERSLSAAAALMAGFMIGTVVTAAACTMTQVSVGSDTYYKCGKNWFQKALANGEVTYVVVNAPPGF